MISTMTLTEPYTSHDEIHWIDANYIEHVADKPLHEIPLEDINSFLEGLAEYYFEQDVSLGLE